MIEDITELARARDWLNISRVQEVCVRNRRRGP